MVIICSRCREESRANSVLSPIQGDKSVGTYFETFRLYTLLTGINLYGEVARERFIRGLTNENQREIAGFTTDIYSIVNYLRAVERFKFDIFNAGLNN
jgi:hypothetical protein